ncbi:MAG: Si-specific NAD(P)(+) transhydrogenase [Opitutae bacterium]|nr:Si-specific NAD(P)(+) transhydrogenase [Opitutae bacterium]
MSHYDLIVIGSGPAGEKGAVQAAQLGKRVALIEKEHLCGGAVVHKGALLSKALRETALYLAGFRQRGLQGLSVTLREQATTAELLHREQLLRQLEQARIRAQLERHRVTVHTGTATLLDPHTVRVVNAEPPGDEEILTGSVLLLAPGSRPHRPAAFPGKHPHVFDSNTLPDLRSLPRQMVVAGSGVIACEYASIFAALGLQTTLIEEDERLLPFLDEAVSTALLAHLHTQGIEVRLEEHVVATTAGTGIGLTLSSGAVLLCENLFVAAGRTGRTAELNLAAAGLTANERGLLEVNDHFQTAQPHIYAAGDVIGFPGLASSAAEQARQAMLHAFSPEPPAVSTTPLPFGIYTLPECAMAGATEETLRDQEVPLLTGIAHYAGNARGQVIGAREGFLKLIFHRDTKALLGVHIFGEQASELVHIGLAALQLGAPAEFFLRMSYNYPTLSELYRSATSDALSKQSTGAKPPSLLRPPAR